VAKRRASKGRPRKPRDLVFNRDEADVDSCTVLGDEAWVGMLCLDLAGVKRLISWLESYADWAEQKEKSPAG
jgi:hypothetical protein